MNCKPKVITTLALSKLSKAVTKYTQSRKLLLLAENSYFGNILYNKASVFSFSSSSCCVLSSTVSSRWSVYFSIIAIILSMMLISLSAKTKTTWIAQYIIKSKHRPYIVFLLVQKSNLKSKNPKIQFRCLILKNPEKLVRHVLKVWFVWSFTFLLPSLRPHFYGKKLRIKLSWLLCLSQKPTTALPHALICLALTELSRLGKPKCLCLEKLSVVEGDSARWVAPFRRSGNVLFLDDVNGSLRFVRRIDCKGQ